MKRMISIATALGLAGCASPGLLGGHEIADATMPVVYDCELVGNVHGASVWGGIVGARNALNEARDQAQAMGATHVVWVDGHNTLYAEVMGEAYRC